MLTEVREKFLGIIEPLVVEKGFELVELNMDARNDLYQVEVLADRPGGGIDLEECAGLARAINDALENVPEDYELTVASPGLDRPLSTKKDFLRSLGLQVRFVLREKVEGKGEYSGCVKAVENSEVLVAVKKREIRIPLDKILKATQII